MKRSKKEIVVDAARRGKSLRGADLSGADLSGARFRGADLRGADIHGANIRDTNLRGAYLYGANLSGADLSGAILYGANLYGANLSGANLSGANLSGANLSGANGILRVGPLGSRGDETYFVRHPQTIMVKCGCKWVTIDEFLVLVQETHGDNKHGRAYRAACELAKIVLE